VSEILRLGPQFLAAWLRNPLQMGAMVPSSDLLAGAMAEQVDRSEGLTLELGAGTGAVTGVLLERGLEPGRLVVVEKDPVLAGRLTQRFPAVRVIAGDAGRLRSLVGRAGLEPVGAVVSSLPLLSMRKLTRTRVLAQVFAVLRADGLLVQFTYSPWSPIPESLADVLGVQGRQVARVIWNLPPANVWVYSRKPPVHGCERLPIPACDAR
jgi:phosphatidylethanolamine/phosphatidyl-N-methylethanolamine N-methyltransferase